MEIRLTDVLEFSKRKKDPSWMRRFRERAFQLIKDRKYDEPWDQYIDVEKLSIEGKSIGEVNDLDEVPEEVISLLDKLGIPESERPLLTGLSVNVDNELIYKMVKKNMEKLGVTLMSMEEAVQKFDWLKDYFMKLVKPESSAAAAYHAAFWSGGLFVHVPKGVKVNYPLQAYFLIISEGLSQTEHTLLILEENSFLNYIEGCAAPVLARYSVHLGVLEAYVKDGANLIVKSLENWIGNVHHRPMKGVFVGDNASVDMSSITLGGKTAIMKPRIWLRGENSRGVLRSVSLVNTDRVVMSGGEIINWNINTSSELLNRSVVMDQGRELFEGIINVKKEAKSSKGHMECNTILIGDKAYSEAIPILKTEIDDVELSHEATLGKIGEDQLIYLESMGFDEEQAYSLIVNGFFNPIIKDLPMDYVVEIKKIIDLAMQGA
ncbi:MAG: Fe-S cluster assembly protein SufB [Candidatus Njordarchaeia archaeon]